jgi:ABC-type spermidine/putrescine transport system permease subunit II
MATRKCPMCLAVLAAGPTVARPDELVCINCGQTLEVAGLSRQAACWLGLAAAAASVRYSIRAGAANPLGWAIPVVVGVVVFGIVSALALMATADLRVRAAAVEAPAHHPAAHH